MDNLSEIASLNRHNNILSLSAFQASLLSNLAVMNKDEQATKKCNTVL